MKLTCSQCDKKALVRTWDEQDGYAQARLMGWEFNDEKCLCPRCAAPMVRRHYSYEHAVEIDYCGLCDLYWFEKDELEALQIVAERATG